MFFIRPIDRLVRSKEQCSQSRRWLQTTVVEHRVGRMVDTRSDKVFTATSLFTNGGWTWSHILGFAYGCLEKDVVVASRVHKATSHDNVRHLALVSALDFQGFGRANLPCAHAALCRPRVPIVVRFRFDGVRSCYVVLYAVLKG
jgi:hypothetical protein